MELAEHCRDAAARNGFVTSGTQGAALGMVMRLAIRQALVVEKGTSVERLATVLRDNIAREKCKYTSTLGVVMRHAVRQAHEVKADLCGTADTSPTKSLHQQSNYRGIIIL